MTNRETTNRLWFGRAAGAAALVLAALIAPAAATAQEDDSLQAFRNYVKRGVALNRSGKPREALASFQKAREIADHPKLALAVGRIYEKIGDCSAAKSQFDQGLADGRADEELEQKLNEALATNAECVDRGVIVVECEPQSATMLADGERLSCPAELELAAGEHTLEVSAPGRVTKQVAVTIEPAGQHHESVQLSVPWQKPAVTYTKYGALGVGGALLVGGILSDASSGSRQDELAAATRQGDLSRANRLSDEADSAQTRTIALYSVATVLIAGGTALWIYDAEAEAFLGGQPDGAQTSPSAPAEVSVDVRADGASVGATFRW